MGKDIQQEFFELRLGIKGYSISTYDLIAYLSDTNKLYYINKPNIEHKICYWI